MLFKHQRNLVLFSGSFLKKFFYFFKIDKKAIGTVYFRCRRTHARPTLINHLTMT